MELKEPERIGVCDMCGEQLTPDGLYEFEPCSCLHDAIEPDGALNFEPPWKARHSKRTIYRDYSKLDPINIARRATARHRKSKPNAQDTGCDRELQDSRPVGDGESLR